MSDIENKVINVGRIVGGDGDGTGTDGFSPITKLEDTEDYAPKAESAQS